jgi:YggT family protein
MRSTPRPVKRRIYQTLQGLVPFVYGSPPVRNKRASAAMNALGSLLVSAIQIYIWLLVGSALLSWLLAFNVLNPRNQVVYTIADFLHRVTEPALRPIRRFVPNLGGIDISPVVLILLLIFVQNLIYEYWL